MNISRFKLQVISIFMIIGVFFCYCKSTKNQPSTTGWNYNTEVKEKFEKVDNKLKKLPKQAKKYFEGMILIPGGTFTMGRVASFNPFEKDSTVLLNSMPRRVTLSSFYICNHEVTNAEYREFVTWMKDSFPQISPNQYYPDTSVWFKEFPFLRTFLFTDYFTDPLFDNYPVLGVSWQQANDYCYWRTDRLNNAIIGAGGTIDDLYPRLRLPTEAEWEYAAISPILNKKEKVPDQSIFPWVGYKLADKKGRYYANFGEINDQNGYRIKMLTEDIINKRTKQAEFFITSPVKSFPPNGFNLYDMAGNVAEWVTDVARPLDFSDNEPFRFNFFRTNNDTFPSVKYQDKDTTLGEMKTRVSENSRSSSTKVLANDNLQTAISKIMKRDLNNIPDTTKKWEKEKVVRQAIIEMHDIRVITSFQNPRIVKGGSWANGPAYLSCGYREAFPEKKGSSRIGFRIAMVVVGNLGK